MGSKMDDYGDYANRIAPGEAHPPAAPSAPLRAPVSVAGPLVQRGPRASAIYEEARLHFLDGTDHFEYGRGDIGRLANRGGDGYTDQSRNERDLDGDGRKGVDCSSFVWRALRNAGYGVADSPFTSYDLFTGHTLTPYARQNFDAIDAALAAHARGTLETGDILLFKHRSGGGQHVGIFKGYNEHGQIEFIGSQTTRGPGAQTASPGSYWNGKQFEIVGALRAKPEFAVRAPLHSAPRDKPAPARPPTPLRVGAESAAQFQHAAPRAHPRDPLRYGDRNAAVATLQRRLFELDYRGENGKPLDIDRVFGRNTLFALKQFQREHGLKGKGVAGPKTEAALGLAEQALLSNPANPRHGLYRQVLDRMCDAERARSIEVGAHSERIAAAVTVECVRRGLHRVDRVEFNRDCTLVRAVHDRPGNAESGLGSTGVLDLAWASRQPIAASTRQCDDVARRAPAHAPASPPERGHALRPQAH
jgi:hypothetical protein